MEKYVVFMLFLPVVFMIHDFEEVIGFRPWIVKNQQTLEQRFPKLARRMLPHFLGLSTSALAAGVAFMFLIVSFCSFGAVVWNIPQLWMGAFLAYSVHIVVHILQWMVFRRYVPVVVTSFLSLPYCYYGIRIVSENFGVVQVGIWGGLGLAAMSLALPLVHWFVGRLKVLRQ
ncbi:MAG: HXXEE domain-containing protein [Paludibacteraceae bacterium]|nr:HXXEE domain-containing protein [Prevotellaceae bacterium]HOI27680.1 HXXEE domain-containing protein [Paludibacteraceae bacterium]